MKNDKSLLELDWQDRDQIHPLQRKEPLKVVTLLKLIQSKIVLILPKSLILRNSHRTRTFSILSKRPRQVLIKQKSSKKYSNYADNQLSAPSSKEGYSSDPNL